MPPLLLVFGAVSFDDAPHARWITHAVAASGRPGQEFAAASEEGVIQKEVGQPPPGSLLARPAAEAGR
eukprot:5735206-Karenia_brevis.AAC.1